MQENRFNGPMAQKNIKIAPSILSADFAHLAKEVRLMCEAGADYIHIDVMDGHFVPPLTIGPLIVKAIKPYTTKPLDTHLMIQNPLPHIKDFADAGSDIITFHIESNHNPSTLINAIKKQNCKAGISLRPKTKLETLAPYIHQIDLILIMSVEPGWGGQTFMTDQLPKIKQARQMIDDMGHKIALEVDGGINPQTAKEVVKAGADILVAGTATFKGGAKHYRQNIARLKEH